MKLILKIAVLLVSFKGLSLSAQQKPIVAICETGEGCTFQLSDLTYSEFDVLEGSNGKYANMNKDGIIVYARIAGKWETFIEEKRSRSELDKYFGGDGYTMIYPFNPKLQPIDGKWKVDIGTPTSSPCYTDISNILSNGLAGASTGGTISFPKPFNAKFLMNNQHVKWRMVNPNQYQGILDFAAGPTSPMKLVYDITLVNEEKIKGLFTFTIKIPTKESCISKIPVTYTCVEPNPGQRKRTGEIDPFAKHKFNVERIQEEKRTQIERIPEEKKTKIERIPEETKTGVERLQ